MGRRRQRFPRQFRNHLAQGHALFPGESFGFPHEIVIEFEGGPHRSRLAHELAEEGVRLPILNVIPTVYRSAPTLLVDFDGESRQYEVVGLNAMSQTISSTHDLAKGGFTSEAGTTSLAPGPYWRSFEDFRTAGNAGLDGIPEHGVATLRCKAGTFRILRDSDFQRLVGLANEVHRLQNGIRIVIQAAKVAVKHPDADHIQLLIHSASLIAACPELPQQEGHPSFDLSQQEGTQTASEDFDFENTAVPRPRW
jgi:hypothetical protein